MDWEVHLGTLAMRGKAKSHESSLQLARRCDAKVLRGTGPGTTGSGAAIPEERLPSSKTSPGQSSSTHYIMCSLADSMTAWRLAGFSNLEASRKVHSLAAQPALKQTVQSADLATSAILLRGTPGGGTVFVVWRGEPVKRRVLESRIRAPDTSNTVLKLYWLPTVKAASNSLAAIPRTLLPSWKPRPLPNWETPPPFPLGTMYPEYVRGGAYLKAGKGQQTAAEFQKRIDHRGIF
jgi:hypothetical protein